MNAIYQAVKAMALAEGAAVGQLTLGGLIDALSRCDQTAICGIDTGDGASSSVTSYRGHYDHLAIEPDQKSTSVAVVLHTLREAVNSTHEGYKGGKFCMTVDVPVWVAHWGDTGRRIVGVRVDGAEVIIETSE